MASKNPSGMVGIENPPGELSRRTLLRTGAWAAPVILATAAVPAAMASVIDLGAIQMLGICGQLGVLRNGFDLIAADQGIPAGTTITLVASGAPGLIWDVSQPGEPVIINDQTVVVTLAVAMLAGATLTMRATFSTGIATIVVATVELPTDYIATGAKMNASVSWLGTGGCDVN